MTTATLSRDLRVYAVQRWPLDKDERRKERLASLLNMTKRRVRSLWEGERTARPRADEIERIEALIGRKEDAHAGAYEAMATRLAQMEADYAALREEMARVRMAIEGRGAGDEGRASDGSEHRLYGRRKGDQFPFTDADERASQSDGWGR